MYRTAQRPKAPLTTCRIVFAAIFAFMVAPTCLAENTFEHRTSERRNFSGPCASTADLTLRACKHEVEDDYFIRSAQCENVTAFSLRKECRQAARLQRRESRSNCAEQYQARDQLCALTGNDRYDPRFEPDLFVDPLQIGVTVTQNPYFPLKPGNHWAYVGGEETIDVTVTDRTKLIDGVRCLVVNDVVRIAGEVVEDTDDWVAQDIHGNVWYCGEQVTDFETFPGDQPADPELIAIDGSFKAGRDGAKAGTWVRAAPQIGDVYRQEMDLGNAEDAAQIVSLSGNEMVPAAHCNNGCLVTREFTPLEPGLDAFKHYAPGIGLVLEVGSDGRRVELIDFTVN